MTNLKVGDKVMLDPNSRWVCRDCNDVDSMNPLNVEGEVTVVGRKSAMGLDTIVVWANGNENQYSGEDLIKMSIFKVDDVVVLHPDSQFYDKNDEEGSNPAHKFGTVVFTDGFDDVLPISVKWEVSDRVNSYAEKDLLKVDVVADIGDTVMIIGGGSDDKDQMETMGWAYHMWNKGTACEVIDHGSKQDGTSMYLSSGGRRQYVLKEHYVVLEKAEGIPLPQITVESTSQEEVMPIVAYKTPKLSHRKYEDNHGDSFKVDTKHAENVVFFEPQEHGTPVAIDVVGVKRLRKQLKNWLDANGHND